MKTKHISQVCSYTKIIMMFSIKLSLCTMSLSAFAMA